MTSQKNRIPSLSLQVGSYLKHELQSRRITQADFAEMIGCDERTVRRWVSGDIHKLEVVEDIASAFNVSPGDIFAYRDEDVSFVLPYGRTAKAAAKRGPAHFCSEERNRVTEQAA